MTKNRAELMVERLRNMQAAAPDIEASAVVSVDGLIMASRCNRAWKKTAFQQCRQQCSALANAFPQN